eukprot:GEMP01015295.1.p1 GENE.GEMP01015295.1~~GEMP01015295.1.p1  ORF type:complete len:908 (+),score=197.07 GEMP01015295.1:188-2911(+)
MSVTSESGSFWEQYGGNGNVPSSRILENLKVLEATDDVTVDSLLDEEDLIQEYRDASNTQLREWLCQDAVVAQLIRFVTEDPPPGASREIAYKYPFVISELLACDSDDLVGAIARNPASLTLFFDFIFNAPPVSDADEDTTATKNEQAAGSTVDGSTKSYSSAGNPVLAGYFSRIAIRLILEFPTELGDFLKPRSEKLFDICVRRLRNRSFLNFFVRLTDKLFPADEGLIMKLLGHFDNEHQATDVAMALDEILQYIRPDNPMERTPPNFNALKQMSSAEVTKFLCTRLVFTEDNGDQLAAAIRILLCVVFHCNETEMEEPRTPDQQAVTPSGEEEVSVLPVRLFREQEESWETFTATLLEHIDHVAQQLDAQSTRRQPKVLTANGLEHPVGPGVLELVILFSTIATSQLCQPVLLEAIVGSKILTIALRFFFQNKWNSLLHNSVKQLFLRCMRGGLSDDLITEFLIESDFENRTAEAVAGPREGNFPHMIGMIEEAQEWSRTSGTETPEGSEISGKTRWSWGEKWVKVVIPKLEWYLEMTSGDLGGPPPQMGHTPSSQTRGICDGEDGDTFDNVLANPPPVGLSDGGSDADRFQSWQPNHPGADDAQLDRHIPPVPESPPPPPPHSPGSPTPPQADSFDLSPSNPFDDDPFGTSDPFADSDAHFPPTSGNDPFANARDPFASEPFGGGDTFISTWSSSSSDSVDRGHEDVPGFSADFRVMSDDPFANMNAVQTGGDFFSNSTNECSDLRGESNNRGNVDPFSAANGFMSDPFAAFPSDNIDAGTANPFSAFESLDTAGNGPVTSMGESPEAAECGKRAEADHELCTHAAVDTESPATTELVAPNVLLDSRGAEENDDTLAPVNSLDEVPEKGLFRDENETGTREANETPTPDDVSSAKKLTSSESL